MLLGISSPVPGQYRAGAFSRCAVIKGFASTSLTRHDAEGTANLLNTLALIRPEP
jgi:hypothetical protein